MSVVIRGMKMPEDCPVCPLAHWNKLDRFTGCEIKKRYFDKADMETRGRPDFCPLVEIPPHGRLIDSSAIGLTGFEIVMCDGDYKEALKMLLEKIERAPTVIEAEVSE